MIVLVNLMMVIDLVISLKVMKILLILKAMMMDL